MQRLKNLLCVILSLFILVGLVGCNKKDPTPNVTSSETSQTVSDNQSSDDETIIDDSSEYSDYNDDSFNDDYSDFDNNSSFDDISSDVYSDEETSDDTQQDTDDYVDLGDEDVNFPLGLYSSAEFTLKNASAPVQKDFLGFNAVYHGYTFSPDSYNRVHTDRSAKAELDAVKKSGISIARTYYGSELAWNVHNKSWDFKSEEMKALYRWCNELKDRGIEVHLSYWYAFKELFDKYPEADHKNKKEPYVYKTNGTKNKAFYVEGDSEKTFDNFATFINDSIVNLHANGCTNVKYLSLSTEPGFTYYENEKLSAEETAEIYAKNYLAFSNPVHKKLKESGYRNKITIVGPNEGARTTPNGYLAKAVAELDTEGAIDLYSSHSYYTGDDLNGDSYPYFSDDIKLKLDGLKCGKDKYIYDEYGVFHSGWTQAANWRRENGQYGTHIVLQQIASLNIGIKGSYMWSLVDQQWPNNITTNTDSFVDGVHYCGLLPNYQVNDVPYPGFYAFQLMANYIGVSGAEVYEVDYTNAEFSGVYSTMVKLPDGNVGIAVANTNYTDAAVKFNFEKSIGKTLYRHQFNPAKVYCSSDAELIPASAKITNCKKQFVDVVPAFGVTVYTSVK